MTELEQAQKKYTYTAMFLHWVMSLLILSLFVLGWYMHDLPKGSPERTYFFALHKSMGLTVALLLVLRIFWRLRNKPPALPELIKNWQKKLAVAVHHSLYLLMFIQPVTGYLSSSYTGYTTTFWGWVKLPQWAEKNKQMNEFFSEMHELSASLLLLIILIHIAGAFASLYIKHDNVLKRMLPPR